MTKYLKLKSLYPVKNRALGILILATLSVIVLYLIPIQTNAETSIPLCEITRGLKIGSGGEDVKCLQRYLNWAGFTVSTTGPGSPGNESDYFGPLTESALIRWQNSNATQILFPIGLTTGTGYFGPLSFDWYVKIVRMQLGLAI